MDEPITIKLAKPLKLGPEVITELTMRPPTAKDYRRLKAETGFDMDVALTMAERLTGQPTLVIDQLSGADLDAVLEAVAGFMGRGRATGSAPSKS